MKEIIKRHSGENYDTVQCSTQAVGYLYVVDVPIVDPKCKARERELVNKRYVTEKKWECTRC